MKSLSSTQEVLLILLSLSVGEDGRIPGVVVKYVDIRRNTGGKPAIWPNTDTEIRKRGDQTGLDTLVVHAVNDGHLVLEVLTPSVPKLTR